jgi:hypothetical protein
MPTLHHSLGRMRSPLVPAIDIPDISCAVQI